MLPVFPTSELLTRLGVLNIDEYPAALEERAIVHLFKNDVTPDAGMTLAMFEEADYDDYGALTITMTTPSMNAEGLIVSRSTALNFEAAAGVDPQPIYGIYVTDNPGTRLIAAQRFDNPQVQGGEYPTAIAGQWRVSEPYSGYGWIDTEG